MNSIDDLEPDWMMRARREIGIKERPGAEHHPRILEYLAATRITPKLHQDETPWCSAFVCWVMEASGIASTRSAAARSWLKWGQAIAAPRTGAISVLSRPSADNPGSGHVGFYAGALGDEVMILSGNQSNSVCIKAYALARVLGYRWPDL